MAAVPPPGSALSGLTILLVEDDQDVRDAVEALLVLEGAEVVACAGAAAALDVLGGGAPLDLLITDVVLGEPLSGFDVAAAAMAYRSALPILLITGYAGTATRDLPRPVPVLLKPFRYVELLDAINAVLRRQPASIAAAA